MQHPRTVQNRTAFEEQFLSVSPSHPKSARVRVEKTLQHVISIRGKGRAGGAVGGKASVPSSQSFEALLKTTATVSLSSQVLKDAAHWNVRVASKKEEG